MVSAAFMNIAIGAGKRITDDYEVKRDTQAKLDADLTRQAEQAKLLKEQVELRAKLESEENRRRADEAYELNWGKAQWKLDAEASKTKDGGFQLPTTGGDGSTVDMMGMEEPVSPRLSDTRSPLGTGKSSAIQSNLDLITEPGALSTQQGIRAFAETKHYFDNAVKERAPFVKSINDLMAEDTMYLNPETVRKQYLAKIEGLQFATPEEKQQLNSDFQSLFESNDITTKPGLNKFRTEAVTLFGGFTKQAHEMTSQLKSVATNPTKTPTVDPKGEGVKVIEPEWDGVRPFQEHWKDLPQSTQVAIYSATTDKNSDGVGAAMRIYDEAVKGIEGKGLTDLKDEAATVEAKAKLAQEDKDLTKLLGITPPERGEGFGPEVTNATSKFLTPTLQTQTGGRLSPSVTENMFSSMAQVYKTNPETRKQIIEGKVDAQAVKSNIAKLIQGVNTLRYDAYHKEEKLGQGTIVSEADKKEALEDILRADQALDNLFGRKTDKIESIVGMKTTNPELYADIKQALSPYKKQSDNTTPPPAIEVKDLPPPQPVVLDEPPAKVYGTINGRETLITNQTILDQLKAGGYPSEAMNGKLTNVRYER